MYIRNEVLSQLEGTSKIDSSRNTVKWKSLNMNNKKYTRKTSILVICTWMEIKPKQVVGARVKGKGRKDKLNMGWEVERIEKNIEYG